MVRAMTNVVALSTALALSGLAPGAAAQESPMIERTTESGPNRQLMVSGIVVLGLSYVPAVIVATESSLRADRNLYIPVAGPWIDYANRECTSCTNETANKVLLVADGIFQGIGALELAGSLLFLETRSSVSTYKPPRLRVAPLRLASGYGLAAVGTF